MSFTDNKGIYRTSEIAHYNPVWSLWKIVKAEIGRLIPCIKFRVKFREQTSGIDLGLAASESCRHRMRFHDAMSRIHPWLTFNDLFLLTQSWDEGYEQARIDGEPKCSDCVFFEHRKAKKGLCWRATSSGREGYFSNSGPTVAMFVDPDFGCKAFSKKAPSDQPDAGRTAVA